MLLEMFRTPPLMPLLRFGSLGRLKPLECDFPGSALRTLLIAPPRPSVSDRATTAPAKPASAAPPASNGVLARLATSPMLFAPLAAVSLTVSPTEPTVLWPFRDPVLPLRERAVDCARVLLFGDDDRPRDEDERERAADEPRELELFREFDVLRPLDALFVLLVL